MNIETETDSTSKASSLQCITIEDSDDEVEIIDTREAAKNVISDPLDTYDQEIQFLQEVSCPSPEADPLLTELDENNEKEDNNSATNPEKRLSSCALKCYLKISKEEEKDAHSTFWSKKTLLLKFKFMNELIESDFKHNRNFYKYYLSTKPGRQNVCKLCFICALKITEKFLNLYLNARKYQRYRHSQKKKEVPDSRVEEQTKEVCEASNEPVVNVDKSQNEEHENNENVLKEPEQSKSWKRITPCDHDCHLRITEDDQERIFNSYWLNSTRELRYKFICDMSEILYDEYKFSVSYYLNTKTGIQLVCKSCFCTVINESATFLNNAMKFKRFKMGPISTLKTTNPDNIESQTKSCSKNSVCETNTKDNKGEETGTDYEYQRQFSDIIDGSKNYKYNSLDDYLEDSYNARPQICQFNCISKITKEGHRRIFCSFWYQKSLSSRIDYIYNLMEIPRVQKYLCKDANLDKLAKFYLCSDRGRSRVCKLCLICILDISNELVDAVITKKLINLKEDCTVNQESTSSSSSHEEMDETQEQKIAEKIQKPDNAFIQEKLKEGWGQLLPCKRNCREKISQEEQRYNFYSYWKNSTTVSRTNFIYRMTDKVRTAMKHSIFFYLHSTEGERKKVCKQCFRLTINESNSFISSVLKYKKEEENPHLLPFLIVDKDYKVLNPNSGAVNLNSEILNLNDYFSNESVDHEDNLLPNNWKPLVPCKKNCNLFLTELEQKEMCCSYWKDSTLEGKTKFITERTRLKATKYHFPSSRESHDRLSRKYFTKKFFFNTQQSQEICYKCFCNLIFESDYLIHEILENKFFADETVQSCSNDDSNPKDKKNVNDSLEIEEITIDEDEENVNISDSHCICTNQTELNKKWTPLVPCINNCHLNIDKSDQEKNFVSYWGERTFNSRLNFISNITKLEFQKNPDVNSNVFRLTVGFYLNTNQGRQKVCHSCFYHIFDVSKTFTEAVFNLKLFNTIKFNKYLMKENMTFLFFNDDKKISESSNSKPICKKCINFSDMKIKQGVPEIIHCKEKCTLSIRDKDKSRLFNDYWREKTVDSRERFICDMISVNFEGSCQFYSSKTDFQQYNEQILNYFCLFVENNGIFSICKLCFCNIIDESPEFVKNAVNKKWNKIRVTFESRDEKIKNKNKANEEKDIVESNLNVEEKMDLGIEKEEFKIHNAENEKDSKSIEMSSETNGDLSNVGSKLIINQEADAVLSPLKRKLDEMNSKENCQGSFEIAVIKEELDLENETDFRNEDYQDPPLKIAKTFSIPEIKMEDNLHNSETLSKTDEKLNDTSLFPNLDHEANSSKTNQIIKQEPDFNDWKLEIDNDPQKDNNPENENDQRNNNDLQNNYPQKNDLQNNDLQYNDPQNNDPQNNDSQNNDQQIENDPQNDSQNEDLSPRITATFSIPEIIYFPDNSSLLDEPLLSDNPPETNSSKRKQSNKRKAPLKTIASKAEEQKALGKNVDESVKKRKKRPNRNDKEMLQGIMEKLNNKFGTFVTKDEVFNNNTRSGFKLFNLVETKHLAEEDITQVERHIRKFPLCESYHYNGNQAEKYLPMGLTSKIMYDLYKTEVTNPVSSVWYNKILEKTDLKFKMSFLSKCDECNAATLQYKLAQDSSSKSKINSQRTAHLLQSEEANNSKSLDENLSISNKALHICSFGFQQSLPTPYLYEPLSYYKQRLWTYSFTIQSIIQMKNHKVTKNSRNFYMWHEGEGNRSTNEISSCLYDYLQNLPPKIKNVILYSTSCNGESRSKTLSAMFLYLVANHPTLESVEHKFLISGHSQLEENLGASYMQDVMKENQGRIHEPNDWNDALQQKLQYVDKSEFEVKNPEEFYDFDKMRKDIFGEESDKFIENDIKWLRYTKEGAYYKNGWLKIYEFQDLGTIPLKDISKIKLSNLGTVSLSSDKKRDLLALQTFLKPSVKEFYGKLLAGDSVQNQCIENNEKENLTLQSNPENSSAISLKKEDGNENIDSKKDEEIKSVEKSSNPCKNSEFDITVVKEEIF